MGIGGGFIFFVPAPSAPTTYFYVDFGRSSTGAGTEASPWKDWWEIDWPAINTQLLTTPVTLLFSSRATWTTGIWLTIPTGTNGSATRRLTLDGQSKYNTVASGAASWQTETVPTNRATFDTTGSIVVLNDSSFIVIRGFNVIASANAPFLLGEANPTTGIHDILIENNIADTPTNGHGVWFGYAEAGCYNITVRNNLIMNTPLEGIYIGHFNYMPSTLTGVVVEYNTLINTGTSTGEGDIDIKPPVSGAIVRYNTMYQTGTGSVLAGVVVQASDMQVYGNQFYDLRTQWDPLDGGSAMQINADGAPIEVASITRSGATATVTTEDPHTLTTGDTMQIQGAVQTEYNISATVTVTGSTTFTYPVSGTPATATGTITAHVGKRLDNILVYNNLFYGNMQAGIKMYANRQSITNAKFLNNTIVGNGTAGFQAGASGGSTITISEFHNNILSENGGYEIDASSGGVTITAANHNVIYHPAGGTFLRYQGVNKSYAQWQALGFDANGLNVDPSLNGTTYAPNVGSPVIGAGSVQTEFTVDKNGVTRGVSWDIGAIEA